MTIGARLKEERLRTGLSQTHLAEHCGVSKNTQINYEKDERSPDGVYLERASTLGVDVLYVLTGTRLPADLATLTDAELTLLNLFRQAPEKERPSLLRLVQAYIAAAPSHPT